MSQEVFIVSAARTPLGAFRGDLVSQSVVDLGAVAIKEAVSRAGIKPSDVDEVYMGIVLTGGVGQHPARQAALKAGLPVNIPCSNVNKVCASGMKSIILGVQQVRLGDADIVVAGGMESMSNAPYYLARGETPYGGVNLIDGILKDGLTDPNHNFHVGNCAENTAKNYSVTREDQDKYAIQSYERSAAAAKNGTFAKEIAPVTVKGVRGAPDKVVSEDEEYKKVKFDKIPGLRPVFDKNGTITAANASSLNDGAAACVLASGAAVARLGLKPLAKVVAYGDAARESIDFPVAPALAIPKVLKKANLKLDDISLIEINEAFSVVALANIKELGLDPSKVNVNGGGVSLGHPIGCSGARITNSLAIHLASGQYGVASICNGGGGASAIVLQKI